MLPFQYYNPTKVVFGCGEFDKLKEECAALGTHALLVEQHGPLEEKTDAGCWDYRFRIAGHCQ